MAIFLTGESRIMIQGITGSEGTKHGRRMLAAGTTVVGGTNPRKAGQTVDLGGSAVHVFGTVAETMAATGADVSVVFVPPAGAKSAVIEAVDAGIPLVVVITEGIPPQDTAKLVAAARAKGDVIELAGNPGSDGAYSAANEAIIKDARSLASSEASATDKRPIAVIIWEGKARAGSDATDEFRQSAEAARFDVRTIATI